MILCTIIPHGKILSVYVWSRVLDSWSDYKYSQIKSKKRLFKFKSIALAEQTKYVISVILSYCHCCIVPMGNNVS